MSRLTASRERKPTALPFWRAAAAVAACLLVVAGCAGGEGERDLGGSVQPAAESAAEAWVYDVPGGSFFGNIATTPLIVGDTFYFETLDGIVHAVDRDTGKEVWRHQASGGINGWPAVAGDLIVVPVGFPDTERGGVSHLLALRLED